MAPQGGNDTYVYSSAGGNDTVADSDNFRSTLQFTDIASTGVAISRLNGSADLVLANHVLGRRELVAAGYTESAGYRPSLRDAGH
jgi:hypothetical protein